MQMSNKTVSSACTGTTKTGKPCKANPLKGTDKCLAHSDAETRASVGFVAEAGKLGGRPPLPKATDVLRERVEAQIDRVIAPLFDALDASRGMTIAVKGGGAEFFETPDHATRIAAVRELLDRVYGRPKQTQEISGPDGAPITLTPPTDDTDRSARAARLLLEAGFLNGHAPENGNGLAVNGNGHH